MLIIRIETLTKVLSQVSHCSAAIDHRLSGIVDQGILSVGLKIIVDKNGHTPAKVFRHLPIHVFQFLICKSGLCE